MRLLSSLAVYLLSFQLAEASDHETLRAEIEQTYGVEVVFDKFQFPAHWIENYEPEFGKVDPESRGRYLVKLREDLQLYKPDLIGTLVKKVFVFDRLSFKGVSYGGTVHPPKKWLYLNKLWLGNRGASAMGFHHEFSSLLLAFHKFPVQEWKSLNPTGFSYPMEGETTALLVEGNTDLLGTAETYTDGFVAGYGQMDFDNDINTFFQLLIANPVKLAALERAYPAVQKKAELLRAFYDGIVATTTGAE